MDRLDQRRHFPLQQVRPNHRPVQERPGRPGQHRQQPHLFDPHRRPQPHMDRHRHGTLPLRAGNRRVRTHRHRPPSVGAHDRIGRVEPAMDRHRQLADHVRLRTQLQNHMRHLAGAEDERHRVQQRLQRRQAHLLRRARGIHRLRPAGDQSGRPPLSRAAHLVPAAQHAGSARRRDRRQSHLGELRHLLRPDQAAARRKLLPHRLRAAQLRDGRRKFIHLQARRIRQGVDHDRRRTQLRLLFAHSAGALHLPRKRREFGQHLERSACADRHRRPPRMVAQHRGLYRVYAAVRGVLHTGRLSGAHPHPAGAGA